MSRKIKVLVVDDSASVRNTLVQILEQDQDIEITGTASDPYEAVSKIAQIVPDVITLDIEMPRMDGLTFLGKLMKQHPIPVVVISSVADEASENGIKALKLGAREIITKPRITTQEQFEEYSIRITDAVKAASMTGKLRLKNTKAEKEKIAEQDQPVGSNLLNSDHVILMGASTGGTEVISRILRNLSTDLPGILIVQHMPGEFTKAFANRLNRESHLQVKEAEDGDWIKRGSVYVANGYKHLKLVKENGIFKCRLEIGPLVNRHRPSVDVLFNSAVEFSAKITAALLTGMGSDGSKGMLALHQAGAKTFAQDETSSVIFGMPREAIKLNAAQKIGTPDDLINWLNTSFH